MGEMEKMAEGEPGSDSLLELREAGEWSVGTPGPQGRQPVQLEIVESPDPVPEVPHEQGPQERRDPQSRIGHPADAWLPKPPPSLFIPEQPVAAPRIKVGRYGTYYDSKAYPDWLEYARDYAKRKWPAPMVPSRTPVEATFTFYVMRAKTHFGTGKNRDAVKPAMRAKYPFPKGDFDNLAKGAADALTGTAYADDVQIIAAHVYKGFCESRDDTPGVKIELRIL